MQNGISSLEPPCSWKREMENQGPTSDEERINDTQQLRYREGVFAKAVSPGLMSNQILTLQWLRNNKNSSISSTGISGNPCPFSMFGSNETGSFFFGMWNEDLELSQSDQTNTYSWTSGAQGAEGIARWLGGHVSCFINLSPPSRRLFLALWSQISYLWDIVVFGCASFKHALA